MENHSTKHSLLIHGTALLREFGYSDTSLGDILRATGVPKGSFYHHFRNKEEFAVEAVQQYARESYEQLDTHLGNLQLSPQERLRTFFTDVFSTWIREDCRKGCLLGTLGQEMADVSERFRHIIRDSLNQWSDRIALCLREAQSKGDIAASTDCDGVARLLVDGFQGAALRMKLDRNPDALNRFLELTFDTYFVK